MIFRNDVRKVSITEGSWFAIPLTDSGYGLGLAARIGKRGGIILGYFFGPRRNIIPSESDTLALRPTDAILIRQFCDPALVSGEWAIVARSKEWHREEWAQSAFGHIDVVDDSKAYRREYPPDDPSNMFVQETLISPEEAFLLPQDGLSGHIALQTRLTILLSS